MGAFMKASLVKLVFGIVVLGAAAAVNAATVTLGNSPDGLALAPGDVGLISQTVGPGSFTATAVTNNWYFTLPTVSGLGAAVTSIDLTVRTGDNYAITGLNAVLFDRTTSTVVGSGTNFALSSLSSDKYDLEVSGNATGTAGGIYGGAVAVSSPVPLPAAAWLLLSGLAGMGAMARRRLTAA
jgi:hypothetical protein